jgi:hypothetical protein
MSLSELLLGTSSSKPERKSVKVIDSDLNALFRSTVSNPQIVQRFDDLTLILHRLPHHRLRRKKNESRGGETNVRIEMPKSQNPRTERRKAADTQQNRNKSRRTRHQISEMHEQSSLAIFLSRLLKSECVYHFIFTITFILKFRLSAPPQATPASHFISHSHR